jgi:SAM-dependent methyltransferase
LADAKEIVASGYDRVARRYADLEGERSSWPRLRRLEALLADLPLGSRVLDVGCGDGIPALAAIAERHAATGVDISATQSEAARMNVPAAHVLHGDVASQEFPAETFAAIVGFYVLGRLPRDEHAPLDVPMYFSQFDEERTTALLEAAGFDLVHRELEAQLEGDREVEYVWFHARKRS